MSFEPQYVFRKKGKNKRNYYVILQVKDYNRFFHIDEPLLDYLPDTQKSNPSIVPNGSPPPVFNPYTFLNIKDTVELLYIDKYTKKDLEAQVYGLKHNGTTYFWKDFKEIKSIIKDKSAMLVFLIVAIVSILIGIANALGYAANWFSGISKLK